MYATDSESYSGMDVFLEKTKLHHVFGKNRSVCGRICWSFVFVIVSLFCFFGMFAVVAHYLSYPYDAKLGDTDSRELIFPTVHFHNFNQIR